MRTLLILALSAGGLRAAVIRGDVVENQSGRPLARTLVVAQPVQGTGAKYASVLTTGYGTFEFPALPGGVYLLTHLLQFATEDPCNLLILLGGVVSDAKM